MGYKYPVTHSPKVAAVYVMLAKLYRNWESLYRDPMSAYCDLGDFAHDYSRKELKLAAELRRTAQKEKDRGAEEFALRVLETYCP
jgi:hypothetical protein